MEREKALDIAKLAYKDVKAALIKFYAKEGIAYPNDVDVTMHWNGSISVDDHFFTEHELIQDD
jgi:hypothetical protein